MIKSLPSVLILICLDLALAAQPYIDVGNVRFVNSPSTGSVGKEKNPTVLNYVSISTTLPFQFNNKRDAVILSPFFEEWTSRVSPPDKYDEHHYGLSMPVSYLKSFIHSKWSVLGTVIGRMNDAVISSQGKYQLGGVVIAGYKKNEKLTYKFGVYVNGEFFGLFLIPLVGIDWQINDRTNLFGVLPASLTLERKLSSHFYAGMVFRTFTNSYHDTGAAYFRVDENQLGIFIDTYLTKNIILNLEAGHSILRKIRTGIEHQKVTDLKADDNFYFKVSLAYRLRLR